MNYLFKGVWITPDSYEVESGQWRAHVLMQGNGSPEVISAVAAVRFFETVADANAIALSWARTLVSRHSWSNGKHLSSDIDGTSRVLHSRS